MLAIIAAALYVSSNQIHIFEPTYLTLLWIDQLIPFLPNTVLIYVSEFFLFWAVYILSKDLTNANKYLYTFMTIQFVSCMIFWIWPTTFPRHLFPLPENLNAITYTIFSKLRVADSPASCAPSLHVSSCYVASFVFLNEQRRKLPFFFLWASLIAFSTLTTKQHYFIDVILGFLMAVITYWIFHRVVDYRKPRWMAGDQANR